MKLSLIEKKGRQTWPYNYTQFNIACLLFICVFDLEPKRGLSVLLSSSTCFNNNTRKARTGIDEGE